MTDDTTSAGPGPHRLAPSADPSWVDSFVLELRLRGAPGAAVGDHLATVEDHLRETGEPVAEAFGDPLAYARALVPAPRTGGGVDRDTVVVAVLGLLGVVLLPVAFGAALDGSGVPVTGGVLVLAVALLGLTVGLAVRGSTPLRALVEHRWVPLALGPALVAAATACLLLLDAPLTVVPAVVVGALGALALAVGTGAAWRAPTDLVRGPGEPAPAPGAARVAVTLMLPAFTVVGCVAAWLVRLGA